MRPTEPGCWSGSATSCIRARRPPAGSSCCRWSPLPCGRCGDSLGLPEEPQGRRPKYGTVRGPVVVAAPFVAADHPENGAGPLAAVIAEDPGAAAGAVSVAAAVELH